MRQTEINAVVFRRCESWQDWLKKLTLRAPESSDLCSAFMPLSLSRPVLACSLVLQRKKFFLYHAMLTSRWFLCLHVVPIQSKEKSHMCLIWLALNNCSPPHKGPSPRATVLSHFSINKVIQHLYTHLYCMLLNPQLYSLHPCHFDPQLPAAPKELSLPSASLPLTWHCQIQPWMALCSALLQVGAGINTHGNTSTPNPPPIAMLVDNNSHASCSMSLPCCEGGEWKGFLSEGRKLESCVHWIHFSNVNGTHSHTFYRAAIVMTVYWPVAMQFVVYLSHREDRVGHCQRPLVVYNIWAPVLQSC